MYDEEYCDSMSIPKEQCNLKPLGPENREKADDQWQWLEHELSASNASFLIVAGHYPIWSIAEHGPTQQLIDRLRPMLIKYNVTLYMYGHDHTFQYIQEETHSDLGFIGSGGTHHCNPSTDHAKDIPSDWVKFHGCKDGGFTKIHIDRDGLAVEYYFGNDSQIQFVTPTFKPR